MKSDHLKSRLFEVQISNGWAIAIVPTILKPDHSKSVHFCRDFKCWASGFQISFNIQWGLKYRTFKFRIHLKTEHFKVQFSNGYVFERSEP